jgi:hypothetical protein
MKVCPNCQTAMDETPGCGGELQMPQLPASSAKGNKSKVGMREVRSYRRVVSPIRVLKQLPLYGTCPVGLPLEHITIFDCRPSVGFENVIHNGFNGF